MNRRVVLIIVGAVAVIGTAVAGVYFATNLSSVQSEANDLTASGFVEAEEVAVASELGGRVLELLVAEGDDVEAGQVLAQLDGTLLEAQIEAAQAGLDMAQAELAQAQAGARPEQVRQAEAALAQVEAGRDGAYRAWQDLIALRDNPQQLDAQIALAEAQVAVAEAGLTQAVAYKDAAQIAYDNYGDALDKLNDIPPQYRPGLQMGFHLIPNAYWKAWVGVNTAQAGLDGARAAVRDLRAMRDNPQDLNAQIAAAEARYRAAEAAVDMAQAQLDGLEAGATAEEIAIVEAQVEQAQAALDSLLVLRDKQTISAPVGGVALEVSIHQGELAAPGGTLLTLGDLDQVTLTVYVPESKLGQVNIGQEVAVSVDSFPDRTFAGTVIAIADEAEFTPRNVQTQEERVNMVFAVDVRIPNPDHALKPGLPADALIVTEEPGQ
ncbi:MAG: efflux RND transporter periplasmic adaptor subunit [Anaerolineae bacterium]|nr:efflux RND transporter periplasmic adaptor subunit [Anaerolineae bacterium]